MSQGSKIVAEVLVEISEEAEKKFRSLIKETVVRIREREQWICARQSQIEELKAAQVELVKLYDSGKFNGSAFKEFSSKINTIKDRKVGGTMAHKYDDED